MPDVSKCMCEECHFNNNKSCSADSIEVHSSGDKQVESYDGTCCRTFKLKS